MGESVMFIQLESISKFCEAVKNRQFNRVGVTGNGKRRIKLYIVGKKMVYHSRCTYGRRNRGVCGVANPPGKIMGGF